MTLSDDSQAVTMTFRVVQPDIWKTGVAGVGRAVSLSGPAMVGTARCGNTRASIISDIGAATPGR